MADDNHRATCTNPPLCEGCCRWDLRILEVVPVVVTELEAEETISWDDEADYPEEIYLWLTAKGSVCQAPATLDVRIRLKLVRID